MKRFSLLAAILILMMTAITALAAPATANAPAFPGTLANARYIYIASYDGDQFNEISESTSKIQA
jgi:hypothetical protein